jgi:hypothetical protein
MHRLDVSMMASPDMFRPQTDSLIEPYLSKPLEEQDAVEGIRFQTKMLIETDGELIVIKSGREII